MSRKRDSEEEQSIETLIRSSDGDSCSGVTSRRLKEIDLEGWTSYQNCKEEKPSKIDELKSDLGSARLSCKLY